MISDSASLASWCIKAISESTLGKNPSVPLMRHDLTFDLSDLGSLIPVRKSQKICGNIIKTHTTTSTTALAPCSRWICPLFALVNRIPPIAMLHDLYIDPSWVTTRKKKRGLKFHAQNSPNSEPKTKRAAMFNSRGLLHTLVKTTNQVRFWIYGREHCQSNLLRAK